MCARKSGTFPKPRLHKRGYLRLRVCGRDFTLGKPGSKQATERHNAIIAAWGANNGTLPADFTISETTKELPQVAVEPAGVVTVADLLAFTIAEVGAGKTKTELRNNSRWYRLRKVATVLETYASRPTGPRNL